VSAGHRPSSTSLKPLPKERFVYGEWQTARVNIDYHIEADHSLLLGAARARDHIGDPTNSDAICDRVLSSTHRILLKGSSRRKEAVKD
jgi:hypothetical protein